MVPGRGGCLVETPGKATAAGGTHPTGMHSCLIVVSNSTGTDSGDGWHRFLCSQLRCELIGNSCD